MKAVIAAAGVGSRLLPITASVPKSIVPVLNKPIIHHLVEQCVSAGVKDIIIVTNRDGYLIQKYFSSKEEAYNILKSKGKEAQLDEYWGIPEDVNFIYIRQDIELPNGNASALYSARRLVNSHPFMYFFDDVYLLGKDCGVKELVTAFRKEKCDGMLTAMKCTPEEVINKAVVKIKEGTDNVIEDIIEKPTLEEAPSDIGTISPFILPPAIIDYLDPQKLNKKIGEFVFQDGVEAMIQDGAVYKINVTKGKYLSNGDPLNYLKAVVEQGLHTKSLKKDVVHYLQEKVKELS